MAKEQYRSRVGHRALDLAVNKTLTFSLLQQLKRPGAMCSNDMKSCYDFIVHSVASLTIQRIGVLKAAVDCIFTTIQSAKQQVRSGVRQFNLLLQWSVQISSPIHGIGQGNGAGQPIWAALVLQYLICFVAKALVFTWCVLSQGWTYIVWDLHLWMI